MDFSMFNMNKNQATSQMNNFWNYLDELSEKNPEEYKKFISNQMKNGFENMKNEKAEENQELKTDKELNVTPFLSLRLKVLNLINKPNNNQGENIKIFENKDDNMTEIPKVLFSFEFQSNAFSNKILEEPKVYLNIVHSANFSPPVDENSMPQLTDDNKWRYIPTQFRYNGKKTCMSGKRCDFYDVIIHSLVVDKINKNEELKRSVLGFFIRKFSTFLNDKYKLFTDNVKILKNKKYKSLKPVPEIFKIISISKKKEVQSETQQSKDLINISNQLIKTDQFSSSTGKTEQTTGADRQIKIPSMSENIPNTSTFYNMPKDNNSSKQKGKKEAPKKIVIEEVTPNIEKDKKTILIKKTILNEKQMEVIFDFKQFTQPEVNMSIINLQVNNFGIKLCLDNYKEDEYEPVDMAFNFEINSEQINEAKFNKQEKTLKLILERIM
jgi:hypothetical protein